MFQFRKFFFQKLSCSAIRCDDYISIFFLKLSYYWYTPSGMTKSPVKRGDDDSISFFHLFKNLSRRGAKLAKKNFNKNKTFALFAPLREIFFWARCYICPMTKHKLQRFAELETFTNVFQPKMGFPPQDFSLKGKWNAEYFSNENPIVLELGCGRGEYTTKLSEMFVQKNFIGIDIKGARLWRGAKTAAENKMPNVCFIRTQIQWLEFFFAKNEVSEIWLTFPDPQPQKSRVRKRLTSPRYLKMYVHILKPQGILHLKTDSKMLFDYTVETAQENNFSIASATDDLYNSPLHDEVLGIRTTYEKMFLDEGKEICYLQMEKV